MESVEDELVEPLAHISNDHEWEDECGGISLVPGAEEGPEVLVEVFAELSHENLVDDVVCHLIRHGLFHIRLESKGILIPLALAEFDCTGELMLDYELREASLLWILLKLHLSLFLSQFESPLSWSIPFQVNGWKPLDFVLPFGLRSINDFYLGCQLRSHSWFHRVLACLESLLALRGQRMEVVRV